MKLNHWKPEDVPVGAWLRNKRYHEDTRSPSALLMFTSIIGVTYDTMMTAQELFEDCHIPLTKSLDYVYSTDKGKTWQQCGTPKSDEDEEITGRRLQPLPPLPQPLYPMQQIDQTLMKLRAHIAHMAPHQRQREAGQLLIEAERTTSHLKHAIETEPELPGEMPDEMWNLLKNDKDATTEALRSAVRQTKSCIWARASQLWAMEKENEGRQ